MYNDTLQHYGVLGMKWGRRKVSRVSNKQKKIAAKKSKYKKISDSEFKNFKDRSHFSADGTHVIMDNKGRKSWNKSIRTAKKYVKLDKKEKKVAARRKKLISKIKASEAKNKNKGKSAIKDYYNELSNMGREYKNRDINRASAASRKEQFNKNWKTNKAKALATRFRRSAGFNSLNEVRDVKRVLRKTKKKKK